MVFKMTAMLLTTILAAALLGRITVIAPKEGMTTDFEAGYKRHLEWHRAANDPWTWHGWTVITGDRLGTFIDATFDHEAEDFDRAVKPAEDTADNAKNVAPYGRFVSNAFYRLRPDLCSGTTASMNAPFQVVTYIQVHPDAVSRFETSLRKGKSSATCFQLVTGGDIPSYILFEPHTKVSSTLRGAFALEGVAEARKETLRHRPDLTYIPGTK